MSTDAIYAKGTSDRGIKTGGVSSFVHQHISDGDGMVLCGMLAEGSDEKCTSLPSSAMLGSSIEDRWNLMLNVCLKSMSPFNFSCGSNMP